MSPAPHSGARQVKQLQSRPSSIGEGGSGPSVREGAVLSGENAAFRIHMWNQWNGRTIYKGMGMGPSSCSLGYSSNKSMEWFYCSIDLKDCAASTK